MIKKLTPCLMGVFLFSSAGVLALAKGVEMKDLTELETQLLDHEGYKRHPYHCPAGKHTVGIGRNLEDKGLSFDEALYLLRNDIEECEKDLYKIFWDFDALSEDRQQALIELRFTLGAAGFREFEKMIACIEEGDFFDAATELMASDWYDQVSIERGCLVVEMLLGDAEDDDTEAGTNSAGVHGDGMSIYFDELIDLDGLARSYSPMIPWEDLASEISDKEWKAVPITEE